jgi:hypothetical protein
MARVMMLEDGCDLRQLAENNQSKLLDHGVTIGSAVCFQNTRHEE